MKKILLIAFLFPTLAFAQTLPIDSTTSKVTFTGIIQAEGLNKQQLYSNAKEWFIQYFKSAKDVLQLDDKEVGRIIGKGNNQMDGYRLGYSIDITLKDGKFRYIISDFTIQNNPNEYIPKTEIHPLEYLLNWSGNKDSNGNYKKSMIKKIQSTSDAVNYMTTSLTKAMVIKTNTNDF